MVTGSIPVSGAIEEIASCRPVTRIGYLAEGDTVDFKSILPQVVRYLRRNTEVSFDLAGGGHLPDELREFEGRVNLVAPAGTDAFLPAAIAQRKWDIGLDPQGDETAANSRWLIYACAGAATVALAGSPQEANGAAGRALLVETEGWVDGLEYLTDNPMERCLMVERAQHHVAGRFSEDQHRAQIQSVFAEARALLTPATEDRWPHEQLGTLAAASLPAAKRIGLQ